MLHRPRFVPPPYQDAPETGRLILRDGQSAQLQMARPQDRDALHDFFARLSPESRPQRFFSVSLPSVDLLTDMCDCSDPRRTMTLLAWRIRDEQPSIIAVGSYFVTDQQSAEVAFAVDDGFQGKGLGTLLLERLAVLAIRHG